MSSTAITECPHPVPTDTCVHELGKRRCGERAAFIIWGKLHEPHELGPKCLAHIPENLRISYGLAMPPWLRGGYAAFDLRPYWGPQNGRSEP